MKILFLANPISGGRSGLSRAEAAARRLEARGHDVTLRVTRAPGDAHRWMAQAGQGVEITVVAGGDGTLNEALNGARDPDRIPLLPFPIGTANMLAHELRVPRDPEGFARYVERGHPRRIDVGRVGERRFLTVLGVGFDALVTKHVGESRCGTLGYAGYAGPILHALADYRPPRLAVSLDGGAALPAAFLLVSNGRNYGGLFSVTPHARSDSGMLDVCLFQRASVPWLVGYAAAALLRRLERVPGVHVETARGIEVRSPAPVPFQVDGDFAGVTPVTVEVAPGAAAVWADK